MRDRSRGGPGTADQRRAKTLHYVGGGGRNWRDPRNWSRTPDGPPLRHLHARGDDLLLISGEGPLDLSGMPHAGLEISRFRGSLRLPDGQRFNLLLLETRWWRRWSRPHVLVPSWLSLGSLTPRQAVNLRLAKLALVGTALVLLPLLGGGAVSYFWVGGNGTWDGTDTTHWAITSGGAGGAGVPTSADSVTFDGNSGTPTVSIAGTARAGSNLNMTAVGAVYNVTGNGWTTAGFFFTNGTLNTAGFSCTWGGQFLSTGTATRTLTLGSSAITASNAWTIATTGLTVTANTAVVTVSSSNTNMTMGDALNWNGTAFVFHGNGTFQWTAVGGTVGAITVAPTNPSAGDALTFNGNTTITGALTATGGLNGSSMRYVSVRSNTTGTQRTITAGSVALTNVLLTDIAGAGAATWTGTLVGDCGGNTGITFTTPATQAWAGGAGNWSTVAQWTSRRPLPQDSVTIASGTTVTVDVVFLGGTIDFTGFTGTFALAGGESFFGGVTLASGMTLTSTTGVFNFVGRGSYTITSNGKAFPAGAALTFNAPGGTYSLGDDLSGGAITTTASVTQTLSANNHNVALSTGTSFGAASTVNLGSGTWTISKASGGLWSANAAATINASTSTITFSDTGSGVKTFAGGSHAYGTFSSPASSVTVTGNNTFATLDLECTAARTITLPAGGAQLVTSVLTLTGASGQLLSFVSSSPGTKTTVSLTSCSGTFTRSNISVSADVTITFAVCQTALAPLEANLGGVTKSSLDSFEATGAVTGTRSASIEALRAGVAASALAPLEALTPASAVAVAPLEATKGVSAAALAPLEAPAAPRAQALVPLEAIGAALNARLLPLETLADLAAVASAPLETVGSVAAALARAPFEANLGLTRSALAPLEVAGGVAASKVLRLETLRLASASAHQPVEALVRASATVREELESLRGVRDVALLPFEVYPGSPRHGVAVGSTGRTSSVTGTRGRTSSVTGTRGI